MENARDSTNQLKADAADVSKTSERIYLSENAPTIRDFESLSELSLFPEDSREYEEDLQKHVKETDPKVFAEQAKNNITDLLRSLSSWIREGNPKEFSDEVIQNIIKATDEFVNQFTNKFDVLNNTPPTTLRGLLQFINSDLQNLEASLKRYLKKKNATFSRRICK